MSEKKWTPADIGGKPVNGHLFGDCGWVFARSLTQDEQQQVKRYVADQMVEQGLAPPEFPPDHAFYKSRPEALEHLAPDHPWRKGTVPHPAE